MSPQNPPTNHPHANDATLPPDSERLLDSVITAYLLALQAGEAADPETWCRRYPDLADELTAFFADRARMERLAQPLKAGAPSAGPTSVGPTVRYFGDYELVDEIARGGMGVVYKARQVSINRMVALKMILAGQLASDADVQRFRREATAAGNLDHPHIVPIYEVGEHQGMQFFSMKLIETGDGPRPVDRATREGQLQAARLVATVARAVHYAHRHGILHRDLKPANILVDAQGQPHVTDFGLAKRVEGDASLTQSGAVVGTPSYMAPEQASAQKGLTVAADVYSLGAILYERLTGQPPFTGATTMDVLLKVLQDEPRPPRSLNPRLDRDLATIVVKCLQKDPARRYASADALADDLDRWRDGLPIKARPIRWPARAWRWCKRNRLLTAACVLVFLALGVAVTAGVFAYLQSEDDRRLRLIDSAAAARKAGDRRFAITQLKEAQRHGWLNDHLLMTESLLTLATPALRHRMQIAAAGPMAPLPAVARSPEGKLVPTPPPVLFFSDDSEDVHWQVTNVREIRKVRTGELVRTDKGQHPLAENKIAGIKPPGKETVLAVNRPGTFALLEPTDDRRGKEIWLWDIAAKNIASTLPGGLAGAPAIAISDDGRRAAFVDPFVKDAVCIWDVPTNRALITLAAGATGTGWNKDPLSRAAGFSPDASLIALHGSFEGTSALLVYEIDTGNLVGKALTWPSRSAWSPDGRWIASLGSALYEVELESETLKTGKPIHLGANSAYALLLSEVIHPVTGLRTGENVQHLDFSPDGKHLSVNRTLLQTSRDDRRCSLIPIRDEGGGLIRYTGKDQRWRVDRGTGLEPGVPIRLEMMAPQRRVVSIKHPGFTAPPFLAKSKTTVPRTAAFALSPTGKQLVALFFLDRLEDHAADGKPPSNVTPEFSLESWDLDTGGRTAIWNSNNPAEQFASVDFVLGGEAVLTTSDQGIKVWDAKTGAVLRRFDAAIELTLQTSSGGGRKGPVLSQWVFSYAAPVILAPGGEFALILTGKDMLHYDLVSLRTGSRQGREISYMPWSDRDRVPGGRFAVSRDGRLLAQARANEILLYDMGTGKLLQWVNSGRFLHITALAFHPDGDVLAVADETGMVRLWHLGWIAGEGQRIGIPLPVPAARGI